MRINHLLGTARVVSGGLVGALSLIISGCSARAPDDVATETVAASTQYVVWLAASDPIVTEHTAWHNGARKPTNTGTDFLDFHRNFLNRLRQKHEALGRPLSERTPWEFVTDDPNVMRVMPPSVIDAYNNLVSNEDPNHGGQPFADENAFGMYLESAFHNPLHGITAQAYPSDASAIGPVNMSPTSSFFFKIHGLVERLHQSYVRGKFYQSKYSDVVQRHTTGGLEVAVVKLNPASALNWTTFANVSTLAVNSCNSYVGAVADLDFNGSNDLVLHFPGCGGSTAIWSLNQTALISTTNTGWPAVGSNWHLIGSADFNQDLRPDLVWADGSSRLSIWFMNGTQFVSSVVVTMPGGYVGKTVGAMLGGANSVYVRHPVTGANAVYFYKNSTLVNSFDLDPVPDLGWDMVGTGYFHAGGLNNKDLLWQHSNGTGSIWFLEPGFEESDGSGITNYGNSVFRLQGPR